MSVRTVAEKYMELCSRWKHFEFMRTFYAPEMVSVEGDGREFVGKEPVIKKSEVFQGNNTIHSQDLRGPFFCGDANANSGRFGVYVDRVQPQGRRQVRKARGSRPVRRQERHRHARGVLLRRGVHLTAERS